MKVDLEAYLAERRELVEQTLERDLPTPGPGGDPGRLLEAVRYAMLGGGKRLRPCLVIATYEALTKAHRGGLGEAGASVAVPRAVVRTACALELLHGYSLVHDDLPAMDNADTRRGRPSVHRAFGEATAVLVGDALLTMAFGWAEATPGAGAILALRGGVEGMILGQARDLAWSKRSLDVTELEQLHAEKTGALFAAATTLGGHCAAAHSTDGSRRQDDMGLHLATYGEALGVLFQHADDIEDGEHMHLRPVLAGRLEHHLGLARRALQSVAPAHPQILLALVDQIYKRATLDATSGTEVGATFA